MAILEVAQLEKASAVPRSWGDIAFSAGGGHKALYIIGASGSERPRCCGALNFLETPVTAAAIAVRGTESADGRPVHSGAAAEPAATSRAGVSGF